MEKNVEMLGVLVTPAEKAKVRRWAAAAGTDMTTVMRSLINGVELEIRPTFVATQPTEQPTVILQRG